MGPLQGSVMSQRSTRETQRTTSGPLLLPQLVVLHPLCSACLSWSWLSTVAEHL